MKKDKQILLSVIGIAVLLIAIVGITYSFFNYTRTGIPNRIAVGNIYFNSNYTASELETTTINDCTKYERSNTNKTYTGLVGLLRVGEMMSAQQSTLTHINSYSIFNDMWIITPYSSTYECSVLAYGGISSNTLPSSNAYGARPTLHLKSGTKITGGSGHVDDPYEIG